MELFIVGVVGAVVSALLFREFGGRQNNASNSTVQNPKLLHATSDLPQNWISDPAYYWMSGNIYYEAHQAGTDSLQDTEDRLTAPSCSYLPGNIFHRDEELSSCTCTGGDWMTDPCCSYMPGNIYHHDADHFSSVSSSFSSDDSYSSTLSTSCFDDTWTNSCVSFDDDWK